MTPAHVREQFPALQKWAWLNAAASSPTPKPVCDAVERHLRETMEQGDVGYPAWQQLKIDVRQKLARLLGAHPHEVALTPSTSFGFHVIGEMLKTRGITEVLTLEPEFPSTTQPLLYDGFTLRGVRMAHDGTASISALEAALTPHTGAIAVSAVQFASGFRVDLEAVGQLCRSRKLAFIVNAAQGIGHVPLDMHQLGIDFLAATSHKWLMAGYGTGILAIAQSWLETSRLPFGGWLSVEPQALFQTWAHATIQDDALGFTATGTRFRKDASALEAGGGNWGSLYALDAALDIHERHPPKQTLEHNISLQLRLREGLRRRGFVPNTPDAPSSMSGICVFPIQGIPLDAVRALMRHGVATSARGVGVRISSHVYNDETDVERALHAIDTLGLKP